MTLLGEMPITNGKIVLNPKARLCYVPQGRDTFHLITKELMQSYLSEPWIFSGTIRENILFGLDYDVQKFNRCIHATALHTVR